jgi:hypothetical protein
MARGSKTATVRPSPAPATLTPPDGAQHTVTLRLSSDAYEVLRELSYVTRRTKSSLLLEGLNTVFRAHGKPPVPAP